MTLPPDQSRWLQRRRTPTDRFLDLLDRLDAQVVKIGASMWRIMIEGFAAYATAQYVPALHLDTRASGADKSDEVVDRDMIPAFLIRDDSGIVMHEDLQTLIESISNMDHKATSSRSTMDRHI